MAHWIYSASSIARPLDPRFKTNLAVLLLMPTAAAAAAAITGVRGHTPGEMASAALAGALVVLVCWALARELAPDDNPGAFASMGLAYGAYLAFPSPVVVPVLALALVRVANRSTGLRARLTDSLAVLLLVGWVLYDLHLALIGIVAALAFISDALLKERLRHQWLFAVLCAAATGLSLVLDPSSVVSPTFPSPLLTAATAAVSAFWLLKVLLTKSVAAVGDIGKRPLRVPRVRAGMALGWLVAVMTIGVPLNQGLLLIWAVLAGLLLGHIKTSLLR